MENLEMLIHDNELSDSQMRELDSDIYKIFLCDRTKIDPLNNAYYMSKSFELFLGDVCWIEGELDDSELHLSFNGDRCYELKEEFLYITSSDNGFTSEFYSSFSDFLNFYKDANRKS